MKKTAWIFLLACMIVCLLPSVGMLFFPTTTSTENRAMAAAPRLTQEDGHFNRAIFNEFETYFGEHMAGRNLLVSADGKIQSGLFATSNVDGVICGTDGWLYYSSTLPDYLGTDLLSDRNLTNLAHNFAVVQDYLHQKGIDFVLTLPPNKNTLYEEHMPYYKDVVINPVHNLYLLTPKLEEAQVRYVNLLSLFEAENETLYLKRDSHWNGRGACLAYNAILDALQKPHTDYLGSSSGTLKQENGDLNKMLYSFYGKTETDTSYTPALAYVYTAGDDVEDGWIVTENKSGEGTLLMFRDSFANTLLPFLSNDFRTACYSKGEPNALERHLEAYAPDCVVIEKVERNIRDYLSNPPILTGPKAKEPKRYTIVNSETTLAAENCENDTNYYVLHGCIDPKRLPIDGEILLSVNGKVRRAYQTDETDYLLYLKKEDCKDGSADVKVFVQTNTDCLQVLHTEIQFPTQSD